jgi:hypothetical protein
MDPTQIGGAFLANPIATAIGVAILAFVGWVTKREATRRRNKRSDPPPSDPPR